MKGAFRFLLISGFISFAVFCFFEGLVPVVELGHGVYAILASGATFAGDERGIPEARHARHDPELGWVSVPDVRVDNMYGPGVYLQTNSQGFRNAAPIPVEVPPGKFRIVCSGDSFTLGFGVSNRDAWCNRLSKLDPNIEAVNMGQGGYGADQAYLWYKRDGRKLDHHVQLFAIIWWDLERMLHPLFEGYEKPMLTREGDTLAVHNVPVPDDLTRRKWYLIRQKLKEKLALARIAKDFNDWLSARLAPADGEEPFDPRWGPDKSDRAYALMEAILADLAAINAEKDSRLVFVFLPTMEDWEPLPRYEDARKQLRRICKERGIDILDLTNAFRRNDFVHESVMFQFGASGGHYSVEGNNFVSRQIFDYLGAADIYATSATGTGEPSATKGGGEPSRSELSAHKPRPNEPLQAVH